MQRPITSVTLVLNQAKAVMYADDITLCLPAVSFGEFSSALDRELQSVVMWAWNKKLVLKP